ncbi:tyrosine-protein phosphatase [Rhodococcus sp. IEGM 1379]|uniref:tyrosine-protein phosphatase n=1 Tax=Rhodococcus sp. IEGM 1379 TaxID=3047086 RepID=UPI0032D588ED
MDPYRSLFEGLAGRYPSPSLFHCTTGKDRTGWAAAALLSILGVDRSDIYHDYLLTNEQLIPALHPVFIKFEAAGGDPELLRYILGVEKESLDTAFDEMEKRYSNIEGYFADGLKVEESTVATLEERLLEPR